MPTIVEVRGSDGSGTRGAVRRDQPPPQRLDRRARRLGGKARPTSPTRWWRVLEPNERTVLLRFERLKWYAPPLQPT